MTTDVSMDTLTLPMGQRLLRAGFKPVTPATLFRKLGCHEIQRLEDQAALAEAKAKVLAEHPQACGITTEVTAMWVAVHYRTRPGMFGEGGRILGDRRQVALHYIPLDHYVDQVIPDEILARVDQARQLGVTEFQVVVPMVTERKRDPAVIGRLGGELILIGLWG